MNIIPIFEVFEPSLDKEDHDTKYPFSCHIESCQFDGIKIAHHYHNEIELLHFRNGSALVSIGSSLHEVFTGQIVIINARQVHSILVENGTMAEYVVIMCDPSVLFSTSNSSSYQRYILPFTARCSDVQQIFTPEDSIGKQLAKDIQTIILEHTERAFGFELAIQIELSKIFLYILRRFYHQSKIQNSQLSSNQSSSLDRLLEYIDLHFGEDITAEAVADICHLNYSYFARVFKKLTGKTFRDYLNYVRIKNAEYLLLTDKHKITEIASQVGYSNTSYFIKQFKSRNGMSPTCFRNTLKISTDQPDSFLL